MTKFILYVIVVGVLTTGSTWIRAFSSPGYGSSASRGSSWSSNTGGGGGSYGGGSGGGGHK